MGLPLEPSEDSPCSSECELLSSAPSQPELSPTTTHSCFGDSALSSKWRSESPRKAEDPVTVSKDESSVALDEAMEVSPPPATPAGPEVSLVACLAKYFASALSLLRSSARLTCLVTANCQRFDAGRITRSGHIP